MTYYAASDAAFVGASLVPLGGHNPLEPAAVGAAVVMGAEFGHQRQAVEALERHGGIRIARLQDLPSVLSSVLAGDEVRESLRSGALAAVAEMRGASRRAAGELARRGFWPVNA
jgi:3-deoxy-D-manno-octulosonic-acid transferase